MIWTFLSVPLDVGLDIWPLECAPKPLKTTLLKSCGTCECKPSWLLEPGDLAACPSGDCYKNWDTRYL